MIKKIKYLTHREIDKAKWDEAVVNAPNGFIYCRSFFLDALCTWDALVAGDYDYILPLPFKTKWGIHYVYTPFFIGQLGIVSTKQISSEIVEEFLEMIPLHFRYIDLQLNENNHLREQMGITTVVRNNYVLPLHHPYHLLEKKFSKDGKKNLRQSAEHNLYTEENISPQLVTAFFKKAYGALNASISNEVYIKLEQACEVAIQEDLGFTIAVKTKEGEIVAVAFLGKDNKRIYYIVGAPSVKGRTMNAQHVLINEVIKKYAGSNLLLDFEGSDIPAVANFYKKFSPELKTYQQLKINRLPFFLKWLKN